MMTAIQIDDEVKIELEKRAYENGFSVFSSPNDILRLILKLDSGTSSRTSQATHQQPGNPPTMVVPRNANTPLPSSGGTRKKIGAKLLREHPHVHARKGYFSKYLPAGNTPYQRPKRDEFPAVLFDPEGYFVVESEEFMLNSPYIRVGKQINVLGGISSIPGYVRCGHTHE